MKKISETSQKSAVPDLNQLASDTYDSLWRGGPLPPAVANLTAKQYTMLVDDLLARAEVIGKREPRQYLQANVQALLQPDQHKPKIGALAETWGAAIALATRLDASGAIAIDLLSAALHLMPPTAGDVLALRRKIGVSWRLVAGTADKWATASLEERPSSSGTTAFARLISVYASTRQEAASGSEPLTDDLLSKLVNSTGSIRLRDALGDIDPLLAALTPVLARLGVAQQKAGEGNATPFATFPAQQQSGITENAETDSRVNLRVAMGLLERVGNGLDAAYDCAQRVNALSKELKRIATERDEANREADDLRFSKSRLEGSLAIAKVDRESVETRLVDAQREVEDWKRECRQVEAHADVVAKKQITRIQDELRALMDRFGRPAMEISKQSVLDDDAVRRLNVNLSNLMDKLDRLVGPVSLKATGSKDNLDPSTGEGRK